MCDAALRLRSAERPLLHSAQMAAKRTPSSGMLPLLTPKLPQLQDRRGAADDSVVKLFQRIQKGEKERRNFRDRRATPRVAVGLDIEARAGDETMMLQTHDLSTFGLSIAGGATPKTGTMLALRLFLPDDPANPLELKAEVVGSFDASGGVRVKFIKPDIDAVRRIHRLVK